MTNNKKQTINSRGFTLMEILATIGIIAILSSVSWAVLKNFQPSLALSSISRDLVSDLRLAQQLSVSEQINHGVFISTSTNEYHLKKFATTTETLLSKQLPSGISFCEIMGLYEGYVIFNPYGSALYPGSICLSNSKGQSEIIDIKPSGFVKIQN